MKKNLLWVLVGVVGVLIYMAARNLENSKSPKGEAVSAEAGVAEEQNPKSNAAIDEKTKAKNFPESAPPWDGVSETSKIENDPPSIDAYLKEKLKQGYQFDPGDKTKLKRTVKLPNGKTREEIIDIGEEFEPVSKTKKGAEELLQNKATLSPEFEFQDLKQIRIDDQNDGLLTGSFKNQDGSIELYVALPSDLGSDKAVACFYSKNQNLFFKRGPDYFLRADGTGYGILKFNQNEFLRFTWSMDPSRVIHAVFLEAAGKRNFRFEAQELDHRGGEGLNKCGSKQ